MVPGQSSASGGMRTVLSRALQAAISLSAGGLLPASPPPPYPDAAALQEEGGGAGSFSAATSPVLAARITNGRGARARGGALGLEAIQEEAADAADPHDSRLQHPGPASTTPVRGSQQSPAQTPDAASARLLSHREHLIVLADGGCNEGAAGSAQSHAALANEVQTPVNWLVSSSSSARESEGPGEGALVDQISFSRTVHHHLPLLVPSSPSPEQSNGLRFAGHGGRNGEAVGSLERGRGAEVAAPFVEKLEPGAYSAGSGHEGERREQDGSTHRRALHQVPHQCRNAIASGLENLHSPEGP